MGFIIGGTYTPPLASIIGVYGTNMKQVHINVDSSNNIYMNAMTGFDNRIIKLNSSGTAQWQAGKQDDLAGTLENSSVTSGVDSSGNYYFAANAYGAGVGRVGSLNLFKYDSSGSIVWQKYIRGASNTSISNVGFYIDSSDNLYVTGTKANAIVLYKLNSSGTVQWGKNYAVSDITSSGSLTVDSSGNVYGSGYITATGLARPFGFKSNSSGVLQWMTSVGDGATNIYSGPPSSTVVDSSGNLYIGISSPTKQIVKFNSSGVVQWQRAGSAGQYLGIDTSGNIYSASNTTDSPSKIGIFKHDSSGSLQWQRTISHASTAMTVESIAVNGSGINIAGITSASGSNKIFFARLSLDGASTGTYSVGGYSYVYAASSISSSTPTLTSSTISATETTDAGSVGTPSGYTLQTPSLSTSVTTISSDSSSGPFGAIMGGTGLGMVISSYVAPTGITQKAIFGYGNSSGGITATTNLVSNTGVVSNNVTGVGTARGSLAAAGYGTDKAIFGYGTNFGGTNYATTNLVSNTGVVATDTAGVGTARRALAAAGYGTDKAIFGYGFDTNYSSLTNLVSNTGVVGNNVTGVGTTRYALAAAGYGTDKAIFGYGDSGSLTAITNLVSNTGVVATDTTGVGTARQGLAAATYGTDKVIFGYGYNGSSTYYSLTNLVSNTGVVGNNVTGVGTTRRGLAASGYGSDKAIFGYGFNGGDLSITNLVSNTGVVATDTSGVGTARYGLAAAGYSTT